MSCATCGVEYVSGYCPRCGAPEAGILATGGVVPSSGLDSGPGMAPQASGIPGGFAAGAMLSAGGFSTGMGADPGSNLGLSAGGARTGMADAIATALKPGEVLADRYEIRAQLGAGGMGAVYRCLDRVRNVEVALKAMLPSLLLSPKAVERFRGEVEVSLQLSHEHIVRVFDVHHDAQRGLRFYTMELLHGESLRTWLHLKKQKGERVTLDEALDIMRQLLEALRVAHRRTIHRDLKPENIFMCAGHGITIKVVDFGIAKVQTGSGGAGAMTGGGLALGTAYYMAPEQQLDAAAVDKRADLYSASVTLYEMLTGKLPVGRFRNVSEERPDLPAAVDEVLLHGLDPDPQRRIASAEDYLAALARLKAGEAAVPARRKSALPLVLGVVVALVLVAGLALVKQRAVGRGPPPAPRPIAKGDPAPGPGPRPPAPGPGPTQQPQPVAIVPPTPPAPADTTPPIVAILKPAAGLVTSADRVEVSGTVDEAHLDSLRVNGEVAAVTDGRFKKEVALGSEGAATIVVVARDEGGRTDTRSVAIERDATRPRIVVRAPPPQELQKPVRVDAIEVEGDVVDRTLGSLETQRGVPIEVDGNGSFRYRWLLAEEGENSLVLVATDKAGNKREERLAAVRDTQAPKIAFRPTARRANEQGDVMVQGTLDERGCAVTIDGVPAAVNGLDFERTVRMAPGTRSFEVAATDRAGNRRTGATEPFTFIVPDVVPGPRPGEFVNKKDGAVMVKVPAGEFTLGSDAGDDDEKPAHTVLLDAYYIDAYEVTVRQFRAFVEATKHVTDIERAGRAKTTWRDPGFPQEDDHPVVFVSWTDAAAYAKWAGKRLPTEAEWEKAASWESAARRKRPFAFGFDELGRGRVFANVADEALERSKLLRAARGLPGYDDGFAATAPAGSFPSGKSPCGAHDMAGNVFEWCADFYATNAYGATAGARNPEGPPLGEERVVRGGGWDSKLAISVTTRFSRAPEAAERALGFRCARDVEP